ncbi:hypothetical protein, partial [uncultured Sphingomonas sp.]|uniref:hypothetical protein n=1 Tax=uncultured Sphingomonas sp. TaxID=158754 RepID=UPI0035C9B2F1
MRAVMVKVGIGTATLMLAGCGHLPFGHRAVPRGGETIAYERQGGLSGFPCVGGHNGYEEF